ncbi:GSU2403 family nucleotidyltransferase fold protein [Billgrantia endophytica]|uniref:Nucleotidyltransferase-like domain-containing protein n=1 Tax=Billgrantia endophytica TaxID=2033802 RepID=A0A2N7TXZ4_9GAMM|nr:GSU2403 family nucleotidyltransferase fold protein [Halomonas endophytica]PMR73039.1 hypothetical protein C1H69_18845 [Halomonas endophytica]
MGYIRLEPEQSRVFINARQVFEVLEEHRRQASRVAGSMHWKTINGRQYLYRAYSYGKNHSLGPRSPETEQLLQQFDTSKTRHQEREASLRGQLQVHAAYIRANRLNRFPLTGARILRALMRQGIPFHLIGTHALYAYEARANVLIEPQHPATDDIDVLMDARQGMRIVANLKQHTLLSVLQKSDASFQRVSSSPLEFRAANAKGFHVDFITQGGNPLQPNDFERLLNEADLTPVSIESLKWLVSSPKFDALVFDDRGMPLRIQTVDPRAFVLHKWYVSQQTDREPLKRHRDESQARLVATLLSQELTDLPLTRAVQRVFPHSISRRATDELDDLDV